MKIRLSALCTSPPAILATGRGRCAASQATRDPSSGKIEIGGTAFSGWSTSWVKGSGGVIVL